MPSLRYSVLSLFQSPLGFLAEISRSKSLGPEPSVHEWIWIEPRCVVTLRPIGQDERLSFQEGRLRLQDQAAELHWAGGRTDLFTRVALAELPLGMRQLLELHFS
jgi:hypothetical protein